jgi:hypothetical protein
METVSEAHFSHNALSGGIILPLQSHQVQDSLRASGGEVKKVGAAYLPISNKDMENYC